MSNERNPGPDISAWERAEVERSAREASGLGTSSLRIADIDRYRDPPRDTVYPLEYCCYLLGDLRGQVAFDLGCGSGENTILLAMRGARVTALDISRELIELAKKRFEVNHVSAEGVRFIVGSAYETDLADDSVDTVLGIGILHHLDLSLAQKEVHRILRTGGVAIFQEPVRDSRLLRFVRSLIPYQSPDVSPFERPLTSEELRSFAAPFRAVEERSFWLPHVPLIELLFPRWSEAAYRWDGRVLSSLPFLSRYAGIRVIKLTK